MWTGGGFAEQSIERVFHIRGNDVLPLACLVVGIGPVQTQYVGQKPLRQSVSSHHRGGQLLTVRGELDGPIRHVHQPRVLQPMDHLGDRWTADL